MNINTGPQRRRNARSGRQTQSAFGLLPRSPSWSRRHYGLITLLFVLTVATGIGYWVASTRAAFSLTTVKSGNWSDASVWSTGQVPKAGETIGINTNHTVTYDLPQSPTLGEMHVMGTLVFAPNKDVKLITERNIIITGTMVMRPASADVEHFIQLVNIDENKVVGGGMDPIPDDVGVWVMGNGELDIHGTTKTSWDWAAESIPQGATQITLKNAPVGWQVGDEITITPTQSPDPGNPDDRSYTQSFDTRTITAVNGATITLNQGVSYPHPKVNNKWTAEVLNLSRNVRIEGTPGKRSHLFMRSTKPQSLKYFTARHFGPRKFQVWREGKPGEDGKILGRWGIHFHHAMDGSRGSIVEGVVGRDFGSHTFVAHASHGITFRNTIAFDVQADAYWWDQGVEEQSHDITYERAVAAKVSPGGPDIDDPNGDKFTVTGFKLTKGTGLMLRDSVAVGVQGTVDASGIWWTPSADFGEWEQERTISHNNAALGTFIWSNVGPPPVIKHAAYYHNNKGIRQGAYSNSYAHEDSITFGNAKMDIEFVANSKAPDANGFYQRYERVVFNANGVNDHSVLLGSGNADGKHPRVVKDSWVGGSRLEPIAINEKNNPNHPLHHQFIRVLVNGTRDLEPSDFNLSVLQPGMLIEVQRRDGSAYKIDGTGKVTTIPQFDFSTPTALKEVELPRYYELSYPDTTTPPPQEYSGDVNGDGHVDATDLNIVLRNYGKTSGNGDLDGNGSINGIDLSIVISRYGN